ncbi:MAG: complement resistance protein TraT [Nitrospiria bacterium]
MTNNGNRKRVEREPLLSVGLLFVILFFGMSGCAATQTAIVHKDLKVQTRMSDTIFLEPVSPEKRTIFIEIRNSSDKEFDLSGVAGRIASRGYTIVHDPEKAHYILQANVLFVGKADPTAIEEAMREGYGPLGGILGGAAIGGLISRDTKGAVIGGLIGGAAEMLAGSAVKNVTFTTITDVQISERSAAPVKEETRSRFRQGGGTGSSSIRQESKATTNRKRYRTRISSTANKTNLRFEEAKPVLVSGLVRALSGLF